MAKMFHPSNMHKFGDWGFEEMMPDEYLEN